MVKKKYGDNITLPQNITHKPQHSPNMGVDVNIPKIKPVYAKPQHKTNDNVNMPESKSTSVQYDHNKGLTDWREKNPNNKRHIANKPTSFLEIDGNFEAISNAFDEVNITLDLAVTGGALNGNNLDLITVGGNAVIIDLSDLMDNINVNAGVLNGNNIVLSTTDGGTVNIDVTALYDNVNLTSGTMNGTSLELTLTDTSVVTVQNVKLEPLIKGSIRSNVNLHVGTNGQIIKADSTTPSGLKWVEEVAPSAKVFTQSFTDSVDIVNAYTTVIKQFDPIVISSGKAIELSINIPVTSPVGGANWGGLAINTNISINGTWYNLGNNGRNAMAYDTATLSMEYIHKVIDFPTWEGIVGDYTVIVEITARSHSHTVTINGGHIINDTTNGLDNRGTVYAPIADDNYTLMIVKEL